MRTLQQQQPKTATAAIFFGNLIGVTFNKQQQQITQLRLPTVAYGHTGYPIPITDIYSSEKSFQ